MTEICKYYYDFNETINKNEWKNDISLINCIDNETYYNVNLKFNNEQVNIVTDFKQYCNILNNDQLNDLNLQMIYYDKYDVIDILKAIDNFKKVEKEEISYSDEYNFFQEFKSFSKYYIDYNNLKLKSKKFFDNKENSKKINVPKDLLFNEHQIFSILVNEINKINNDKNYKHYIVPFEDNIYDLRAKIYFTEPTLENIPLELKFMIDPKLYPFYPPRIEVISPKLKLPLLLSLMNLNILKLDNWNYTISFEWLINNIYEVLNPIINNYIDMKNLHIDELEDILIKLSFLSKEKIFSDLNIDLKINKTIIKNQKDSNTNWKSGTGYGNDKAIKWDIKNYILEKENQENEFKLILESISKFINADKIDIIKNSCLLTYILSSTLDITLLSVENNKIIIESVMKILDQLYDFKNNLPIEFIINIVNNLKNINDDLQILFVNNEDSMMNFLYQTIHNNYNKYKDYISKNSPIETIITSDLNKTKEDEYVEVMKKLQFGTAEVSETHLFISETKNKLSSKELVRVISELSSLKNSLPLNYDSTIWMKVPKKDMNIFTFMISGPKDTPYENGLFFFNGYFPQQYPDVEPKVLIQTTGMGAVRFNPNLYANGKVCLSLLGTWSGEQGEKWNSKTSSFLQVLVSIQSLILVEQPYFNEPGYERTIGTPQGIKSNFEYNEPLRYHTIELAIVNQIKNGPPEYKEIIENHFRIKKDDILSTCKKWTDESIKLKTKMNHIYNILEETLNTL